jgi:hypothetical protein
VFYGAFFGVALLKYSCSKIIQKTSPLILVAIGVDINIKKLK